MAVIRYVATGKPAPKVAINFSVNGGKSWQERILAAGQSFHMPPNCTNLLVNNVPYDPKGNYEIRDGKVAQN